MNQKKRAELLRRLAAGDGVGGPMPEMLSPEGLELFVRHCESAAREALPGDQLADAMERGLAALHAERATAAPAATESPPPGADNIATRPPGSNRMTTVAADDTETVPGKQKIAVDSDHTTTLNSKHTLTVSGDQTNTLNANRKTSISSNDDLTAGGTQEPPSATTGHLRSPMRAAWRSRVSLHFVVSAAAVVVAAVTIGWLGGRSTGLREKGGAPFGDACTFVGSTPSGAGQQILVAGACRTAMFRAWVVTQAGVSAVAGGAWSRIDVPDGSTVGLMTIELPRQLERPAMLVGVFVPASAGGSVLAAVAADLARALSDKDLGSRVLRALTAEDVAGVERAFEVRAGHGVSHVEIVPCPEH